MEARMSDGNNGYGFGTYVDLPYDEAVRAVTEALKSEGFGILTEIDVQGTFKKKLEVDFRRYVILGACNPFLAHRALSEDLAIGLLLPCNVIVYEEGDGSVVSIADPRVMLGVADTEALVPVADEARDRLMRALDQLKETVA
jgi:uncharacterized protein (DUF302 family)